MAVSKPTIVLIPGSFCSGALQWDPVINKLHNAGYETLAVELPTVGPPSTAPAKNMADDAAHIHGIVEALADDGKDVLLAMSSYGGIPGTQALTNVTRKERKEQGKEGGVTGLVYVASVLVNEGESSNDNFAAFAASNSSSAPILSPSFLKVSV
jgi:pimeloyl-ACP methyl ester carboxylesterase